MANTDKKNLPAPATSVPTPANHPATKTSGVVGATLTRWQTEANSRLVQAHNELRDGQIEAVRLEGKLAATMLDTMKSVNRLIYQSDDILAEEERRFEKELQNAADDRARDTLRRERDADRDARRHTIEMAALDRQLRDLQTGQTDIADKTQADRQTDAVIAQTKLHHATAVLKSAKTTEDLIAAEEQKAIADGDFKKLEQLRKARDPGPEKKKQPEDPDQLDLNALLTRVQQRLRAARQAGKPDSVIAEYDREIAELEDAIEGANAAANALK